MDQRVVARADTAPAEFLGVPPVGTPSMDVLSLTYGELLKTYLADCEPPRARSRQWTVVTWLDQTGTSLDDAIGDELLLDFEEELARVRARLAKQKSDKTAANFSSDMRSFRSLYLRELNGGDIPASLVDAIQLGLKRLGKSAHSLRDIFPESVYHWAVGNTTPKRNGSLAVVHQLEEYLELPHNSLAVRAHRKPIKVHDLSKDVPHRRYTALIRKHKYRLREDQVPAELRDAIELLVVHKKKADHMLPNGSFVSLMARETWNKEATVAIRKESIYAFFGFLALPKATKPESAMGWEDRMDCGLGLPVASFRLTMLLNTEYLYQYLLFCQMRTFDEAAFAWEVAKKQGTAVGECPIRRTLSTAFSGFSIAVNNLVNKPHSFFRMHPQFAKEAGISPKKWEGWLDERHVAILKLCETVRKKVVGGKRSNKALLQTMLRAENPLAMMHDVLEQMRKAPPPSTAPMWFACHYRDIALLSVLLWDPLRLGNLTDLEIGKHIKFDLTGRLVLEIDKSEFKNAIFGHAESRYRRLPDETEADVKRWLDVRQNLPGHDLTPLLFIAVQKKPSSKGTPYVLNRNSVYAIFKKTTVAHLGLHIGPHAFRTLVATAVGKVGTIAHVKAILNDSEDVAMNVYRDSRNADEFKALDAMHELMSKRPGGATR